jgi:tRNA G18 (ribose-2'-O)-methylase SpoU
MDTPNPLLPDTPSADAEERDRVPLYVVLDNIRSAYNVGSMFRTGDACAIAHIHLCGMSAHPPHKKLDKTALGAQEHVPWTYWERTRDCLDALAATGIAVIGVEVTDTAIPLSAFRWPQPVAVVFGNEVDGINERRLAQCDAVVRIPMRGHKNSLNVATAFGIVLYNILHQWDIM